MSKSVRGLLTSLKRREPLPRLDGKVPSDINKSLRDSRSLSEKVSEVVRLRKQNRWDEIAALNLIKAYADIIVRIEAEPDGKVDNRRKEFIERHFKRQILNLDSLLLRLKIPVVLYLRVHCRMNNPIRLQWIASPDAVNKFTDWMETEAAPRFDHSDDLKEYIELLSTWDNDHLKKLLEEWYCGEQYINAAMDGSIYLDKATVALVELENLPGGYLITVPEIMSLYDKGLLLPDVRRRIELSLRILNEGDTKARFQVELERRKTDGALPQ